MHGKKEKEKEKESGPLSGEKKKRWGVAVRSLGVAPGQYTLCTEESVGERSRAHYAPAALRIQRKEQGSRGNSTGAWWLPSVR